MALRKASPCVHGTLTSIDSADSVISGSELITCRAPGFHTLLAPLVSGIPELSCLLVLGSFSELSGVGGHFKGLRILVGKRVPETSRSYVGGETGKAEERTLVSQCRLDN